MCKPDSNLFNNTQGDNFNGSIQDNIKILEKLFPIDENHEFGILGKSKKKGIRNIISTDQYSAAETFWTVLSHGAKIALLENNKGLKATFSDTSIATYRVITSTPDSPAIQFSGPNLPLVKIHFIKQEDI